MGIYNIEDIKFADSAKGSNLPAFDIALKPGEDEMAVAQDIVSGRRPVAKPTGGKIVPIDQVKFAPERRGMVKPDYWNDQLKPSLIETGKELFELPKSLADVALSAGSGALGWLVGSGLGLAEATKPGSTRESVMQTVTDAANRIAVEPKTRPAKYFMGKVGEGLEAISGPVGEAAALIGESWNSPLLEQAVKFAGELAAFELTGKGAKKVGKALLEPEAPLWYRKMTVRERGLIDPVIEGMKADIASGYLTNAEIRELWKDPANRETILKRYSGVGGEATGNVKPTGEPVLASVPEAAKELPAGQGFQLRPTPEEVRDLLATMSEERPKALPAGQGFELRPTEAEAREILTAGQPKTPALPPPPEGTGEGFYSHPGEPEAPILTKKGTPFLTEQKANAAIGWNKLDRNLYEVSPVEGGYAITRKTGREFRPGTEGVEGAKTEGAPDSQRAPEEMGQAAGSQPSPSFGDNISTFERPSQGSILDLAKKVIGNQRGSLKMVERWISKRSNAPEELRTYEVSVQPHIVSKFKDKPAPRTIRTLKEARDVNANPERVADWQEIYAKSRSSEPMAKWADVKKVNKEGKLENIPVVSLTKGCQRAKTTVERVENGVLPNETRVESCFGGDCWVNDQFNRVFSDFENMEVRDLKVADASQIGKWLADPRAQEWLNKGPFIRMGQQGCDSHTIASGLALEWLKQAKANGIKKKTVMISAAYAPVTKAQYRALAPYADMLEIHFSNSGWFHKNEIMTRLAEFQEAKEAGVPAKIRIITNKDGISGIEMPNQKFLDEQIKKMGVTQDEILETPFHDDKIKKDQKRSEPTGEYKNICCETGKCLTCGVKCMTRISPNASVATSASLKQAPSTTSKMTKPLSNQRGSIDIGPMVEGLRNASAEVKKVASEVKRTADEYLGSISTRLGNIDPSLKYTLRNFEFQRGMKADDRARRVTPFMEKTAKMTPADKAAFDIARKNGDPAELKRLVTKYGIGKEHHDLRVVLKELYDQAKAVGYDVGYRPNYHPRVLKDPEGFLQYFYKQKDWPVLERAIREKETQLQRYLTDEEKAHLINNMLRGYPSGQISLSKPGQLKERQITNITPEINKFYMDSDAALLRYISDVTDAIEARKLFGKTAKGGKIADVKDTIGGYVLDLLQKGKIKPEQERPLRDILDARFNEVGTRGVFGLYKNMSYLDTMGSPISAITQIGDLAWALYKNGIGKTFAATGKAIAGRSPLKKEDIGIGRIASEFADTSKASRAVDKVFRMIGLEKIDAIGKEALIGSTYAKARSMAVKDPAKLATELKPIFEGETAQVVADLKAGKITENVKLYLFNTLADFQPIALSEMPAKYLTGGNGRIFYQLKTFTLKQFDVFRREAFQKIATEGQRAEGMKNLVTLAGSLVAANATADVIKDLLLGRPLDLPDKVVDNLMRLVGVSKFATWKAREEGPGTAAVLMAAPPFKAINAIYKDIMTAGDEKGLESVQSIPLVGKLYYWWFGKGAGKSEKKRSDSG